MTRSELIRRLRKRLPQLAALDVDLATRHVLEQLSQAMMRRERVEIRCFGVFVARYRPAWVGRNPNNRALFSVPAKYVPCFRPSELWLHRMRLSESPAMRGRLTRRASCTD